MRRGRPEGCTGLFASWCPNCGQCCCPTHVRTRERVWEEYKDGMRMIVSDRCPLHSKDSDHPRGVEIEGQGSLL